MQNHTSKILIGLLLLGASASPAQELIRNYGEERAGTTVLQFLKIGVGARAEGMAQAYVGVADDASALYWNPAGLNLLQRSQVSFHHLDWPADITYDYIGYVHRLSDTWKLGLAYAQLKTDEMPVTTEEYPDGNGQTFLFMDQALQLTASLRLTNQFAVGASVKYVREDIADVTMSGMLLDLGTHYMTGWRDLSVAVALVNFSGQFRPDGSYDPTNDDDTRSRNWEDFPAPTVFRLGSAVTLWEKGDHSVLGSAQVNHPVDNLETYHFGTEYGWRDTCFLRGGWKFNGGEESWAAGVGLKFRYQGIGVQLDLSYSDFGLLGDSQRLSSQVDWQ
jgi:hypothetical protein